MNKLIEKVNQSLEEYMVEKYPEDIFKSMKYTVTLPGKRLRPIMCLESCRFFGGDIESAMPTACAIEMLHAQSLIHDDLPCMDNDDYRMGKLTNHKVFGEAIATLAGDALLTYAPQVITKYSQNLSPSVILRVLNEYFKYAGAYGVIAGQVVDIESEGKYLNINSSSENKEDAEKILEYLHLHKTSDLFQLAMRTGAIIAGVEDDRLSEITEFAKTFGLAFQIADDILDEISTFEQMGKTMGKDKAEGKLTYVSLYGLEGAKCKLTCLLTKCHDIMDKQNMSSVIFSQIIDNILQRAGNNK